MSPSAKPTQHYNGKTRKFVANDQPRAKSLSPEKRTGVSKVYSRRRRPKTHPKVLGHLDSQIGSRHNNLSPLLSLPPEIRLMIWRHALTGQHKRLQYDTSAGKLDLSQIGAGLIATCHQIALETTGMPSTLNKLCFDVAGFLKCVRKLRAWEGAVEWELS